ncbi:cytochrome c peroxidase [Myxococcaceae bacterium GXIMD 01537]
MNRQRLFLVLGGTAAAVGVGAYALRPVEPPAPAVAAAPTTLPKPPPLPVEKLREPFAVLPGTKAPEDSEAQVELGRMLFHETRLSKNHDVSCNSCHGLDTYGVDNKRFSDGHKGQKGTRNSPTVYNAAHHIAQFWDGRAATLEEQAAGPVTNPVEMAMPDEKRVVATLASIPEYEKRFREAFPGETKPLTLAHAARAIAAFERRLVTPSRFDRFLSGEATALTEQERRGLETFIVAGCTACHNGPAVGGTSFQKFGLVEEFPDVKDVGRFEVTKNEEDRFKFRVPTLRNVEKTGPYFHDGSVTELGTAVRLMARHQLGRTLTDAESEDILAFLKSLTGELPPASTIAAPALPPSSAKTPKPDPT